MSKAMKKDSSKPAKHAYEDLRDRFRGIAVDIAYVYEALAKRKNGTAQCGALALLAISDRLDEVLADFDRLGA